MKDSEEKNNPGGGPPSMLSINRVKHSRVPSQDRGWTVLFFTNTPQAYKSMQPNQDKSQHTYLKSKTLRGNPLFRVKKKKSTYRTAIRTT